MACLPWLRSSPHATPFLRALPVRLVTSEDADITDSTTVRRPCDDVALFYPPPTLDDDSLHGAVPRLSA
ncbi:hypothetical protein DEM34_14285 [Spiribacter halobius]|uniref:Uncharacterized protein n=1 Tax=Sediminicurvatus halobius TaxID=2182432 RepID=A0A2U2MYV5_9GAMM|nr:hypothetical protein DEM34_14285 [Spiribacter halobius]